MAYVVMNSLVTADSVYENCDTLAEARKVVRESGHAETLYIVNVDKKGNKKRVK